MYIYNIHHSSHEAITSGTPQAGLWSFGRGAPLLAPCKQLSLAWCRLEIAKLKNEMWVCLKMGCANHPVNPNLILPLNPYKSLMVEASLSKFAP